VLPIVRRHYQPQQHCRRTETGAAFARPVADVDARAGRDASRSGLAALPTRRPVGSGIRCRPGIAARV